MFNRAGKAHTEAELALNVRRKPFLKYLLEKKTLYIMLLPGLIYLFIFNYIPMFGVLIAFKDFNMVKGVWGSAWIGLENFRDMFTSKDFYSVLKNSLYISVCRLVWSFPFPILLAILLNEVRSKAFKRVTQTVLYFPYFVSWVVLAGIIMNFLSTEGLVNNILKAFGQDSIAFLQRPEYFVTILITAEIWKSAGWGTIIYLAAISGIDHEMYEAAHIDGAGRLRMIWNITLPSIMPTIVVMLILNAGGLIRNGFEQIFLLYNPTLYDVADVIETYTYRIGIQGGKFSYSTAIGLFQSVVALVLMTIANRTAKGLGQSGLY